MVQDIISDKRMYQAGLLRIVLKMKTDKRSFESCLKSVIEELRLQPEDFRKYVNAQMPELVVSVKNQGGRVFWKAD